LARGWKGRGESSYNSGVRPGETSTKRGGRTKRKRKKGRYVEKTHAGRREGRKGIPKKPGGRGGEKTMDAGKSPDETE